MYACSRHRMPPFTKFSTSERVRSFKSEIPFKKLVSETATTGIDRASIRQSVAK
ncbi:hypothetical protein OG21DRAFT_1514758 [Imleria badia]|nr:hypothetical protein OG21DRAFT_1514758 [Imleria badia]